MRGVKESQEREDGVQGVLRGRGESRVMHGLFRWAPEQDCFFFFSQKSWSLISVLSKPTTQHHYSDFLLLPTNLPFIHCLKKKTKTICSFPNPHTAYPNASFSSTSDSLLWLPSSLLVTSFHPVHLPQSNCYGPSLMWY